MNVFDSYSEYYNILYRDKDYKAEAEYVDMLIGRYLENCENILELGCGTGKHARLLAEKGYKIHAIDQSAQMISLASDALSASNAVNVVYDQSDIRSFNIEQTFDCVISLFHVISYLTSNEDLSSAFSRVFDSLKPGGIFIFDCWYGPAVLTHHPEVRIKRLSEGDISITRIAEPTIDYNANTVNVHYTVFIDKNGEIVDVIEEDHLMRYLFYPELSKIASDSGLRVIDAFEWMTNRNLSDRTWGACLVLKK